MLAKKTPVDLTEFFFIIFFAIATVIIMAIAKKRNFFSISQIKRNTKVSLKILLISFFIYIAISATFSFSILKTLILNITSDETEAFVLINFINNILIIVSIFFTCFFLAKKQLKNIWKEQTSYSYFSDIKLGFITLFITYPPLLFFVNFLELIIKVFFQNIKMPDQISIEYLKMTFKHPTSFFLASIMIIIFVPIIEEFLFRGLLQNYIRKFFGKKYGIILTSIIFAIFHYSSSQKYSNLIIISTLFILSLFLGLIYEKHKSLISPIILHATFNALTIFNLFIFKET